MADENLPDSGPEGIFAGMPLIIDPSVPEDHIRFKHPDGRVEDFPLDGEEG